MLQNLPVSNCMHFLMPVTLEQWTSYNVPGIVGVMKKNAGGQFTVLDAFACESVPNSQEILDDQRYGTWVNAAGNNEDLRFDVFLMPRADYHAQQHVLTLLERSCGFKSRNTPSYAHAV